MATAMGKQIVAGSGGTQAQAVGPVIGEGIIGIGDSDNAGGKGDALAGEAMRVTVPVPALVMATDHGKQQWVAD